ncbi:uncharacterized protein LOC107199138 isoform X2 [Parus major]|uniref:uncharacterized protein LOC107199138 isoform X2 n=1 Tax=Parus major TaxID=9157 RepID=UPI00144475B0|nr:uncharacterized protein LOC107199138 isoform X2 [Parus major]
MVLRMRTSAELRREGGARPLRGADWPRRVVPAHLQQVRGADWFSRAGHAHPGTAPPAVGARPPPRTDGLAPRSAAAMADSAAQFSLVSSTSSSSSVTSSSASSARAPLGGCTGGSSMSCAGFHLSFHTWTPQSPKTRRFHPKSHPWGGCPAPRRTGGNFGVTSLRRSPPPNAWKTG